MDVSGALWWWSPRVAVVFPAPGREHSCLPAEGTPTLIGRPAMLADNRPALAVFLEIQNCGHYPIDVINRKP